MKYKYLIRYILSITLLFIILYVITNKYDYKKINKKSYDIKTVSIIKNNIIVFYPYYKNSNNLNKEIRSYIYNYVKNSKSLKIDYYIYKNIDYSNLVFKINNNTYYNILYDKSNNIISITDIYDTLRLKGLIKELIKEKYSESILNDIELIDINNYTYVIDEKYMYIYFNSLFDTYNFIPYIKINQSDLL